MENLSKEELAEYLWLEINKAIIESDKVKKCMQLMKQLEMVEFLSKHDYILDGKILVEKLLKASRDLPEEGRDSKVEKLDKNSEEFHRQMLQNYKINFN